MDEHMLTTIDNPFDPFTQYDQWSAWDIRSGYYTPNLLDRIIVTSTELSDADQSMDMEDAIAEIIKYNTTGMFKAVVAGEVLSKAWQDNVARLSNLAS